jgi:transcription initiation factor TFIIE subunit alpha
MLLIIEKETLVELARLVGGEEAAKVMRLLTSRPGIVDEQIAKKLNMDVREVRKILHRLNSIGILYYELARDKKTDHRIFKWYVQEEQATGFIISNMQKIRERLIEKLQAEESNQFYWCGTLGHPRLLFDQAMEQLFRCPVCKKPMEPHENRDLIEALKRKIKEIEKALSEMTEVRKPEVAEKTG